MPKCTCCGQEYDHLNTIGDEDHVCDFCLESAFQFCDECEEYYDVGSVDFFVTTDDRIVCQYCAEDMDPEDLVPEEE